MCLYVPPYAAMHVTCLAASNGGRCSFTHRCVHPERHGSIGASGGTATGAESSGGFVNSFAKSAKSEKLGRREASSGRREREGEPEGDVAIFAASSRTSRHLRSTSSAAAACSAAELHG